MKAIVCHRYGAPEALRLEDLDKPSPGNSEVRVHVRAASLDGMLSGMLLSRFASQSVVFSVTRVRQEDLVTRGELLESRKVTPVIDSRHRLSETSEAFRRLAESHARGKIVVTVDQNDAAPAGV